MQWHHYMQSNLHIFVVLGYGLFMKQGSTSTNVFIGPYFLQSSNGAKLFTTNLWIHYWSHMRGGISICYLLRFCHTLKDFFVIPHSLSGHCVFLQVFNAKSQCLNYNIAFGYTSLWSSTILDITFECLQIPSLSIGYIHCVCTGPQISTSTRWTTR